MRKFVTIFKTTVCLLLLASSNYLASATGLGNSGASDPAGIPAAKAAFAARTMRDGTGMQEIHDLALELNEIYKFLIVRLANNGVDISRMESLWPWY